MCSIIACTMGAECGRCVESILTNVSMNCCKTFPSDCEYCTLIIQVLEKMKSKVAWDNFDHIHTMLIFEQ